MSVLVVGSVALDTIITPFGRAERVLGGSASYFSVSASNFTDVRFVGVIGRDFPEAYVEMFLKRGVNLEGLQRSSGKTFFWKGEYGWDFADPQTHLTALNVFADFKPKIPPSYRDSKYVFLANIDPQLQLDVLDQVKKPRLVACDTMNYWIENKPALLNKLLKRVDIFLLNSSEAKELTDKASLLAAGKALLKKGPKAVLIKKGENGSLLFTNSNIFTAPAYLLESIVDPTGAGDTFAGGFMGYLAACGKLTQESLRKAVIYASVMATFTVEDFSLKRLEKVNKKDISQRLRQFKKYTWY
jgi:sugar/nucleoside kinase (ribokinase family)